MRPFIGAKEFIAKEKRYCLWLLNASISDLRSSPIIKKKVEAVRVWRSSRSRANTVKLADTPTLFAEIRQPTVDYLAIPTVCSETRDYIPMDFLSHDVIASNQLYILPGATLYDFGILTSRMHMVWMRCVGGRLKSDYRYSASLVYNNYPWPDCSLDLKNKIEKAANDILIIRRQYSEFSYADLYDPLTMPVNLRDAHRVLDKLVESAYQAKLFDSDEERLSFLFSLYYKLSN